ncbi:OmpP1/FadL family transporter [Bermanella sp. R86510]|uniref:OmpP1/FadL family transporter n=1 Tax=unclassified Bermanella TaxID=2627862 RepID=UPI0037C76110
MKHPMVKMSVLSASILAASSTMAGGFDNSSRAFNIIYGDNNVIDFTYGQTSVPMKAQIQQGAGNTNAVVGSGEIIDDFTRPQVGIRYNLAENVTCAAQVEQPFAAKVSYADDSLAYMNGATPVSAPIDTEYNSESLTFACGYTFGFQTGQVMVFGGPKLQSIDGSFSEDLSPSPAVTGQDDNLFVELDGGNEVGYILGAAYEIPEYALRASILYHSQIDYDATGTVSANIPGSISFATPGTAKTFTPQSVELAFQSGIAENTLAFLKMRWSEYGKLTTLAVNGDGSTSVPVSATASLTLDQVNSSQSGQLTSLIDPSVSMFSNDTFDYSLGLGHRLNDQLTLGASFSGGIKLGGKSDDTPLGADSTSLRLPGDTSHTISLGGEYSVLPNLKVSGGLGYTFIDAYRVQTTTDTYRAEFDKTEATSFQFGLTYEL